MEDNVIQTDVANTDSVPTLSNRTREKMQKVAATGMFAFGSILLLDDALKKFRSRRKVKVVVVDKTPDSTETPST